MNIVFQQSLRPELLTVYGPIEYRIFRSQLEEIDRLLVESKLEDKFLFDTINGEFRRSSELSRLRTALRSNILRTLLNKSCRDLSCDIAGNPLYQWFICIDKFGNGITTPSKSQIDRFEKIWKKEKIEGLIHSLNFVLASSEESNALSFPKDMFDFLISMQTQLALKVISMLP